MIKFEYRTITFEEIIKLKQDTGILNTRIMLNKHIHRILGQYKGQISDIIIPKKIVNLIVGLEGRSFAFYNIQLSEKPIATMSGYNVIVNLSDYCNYIQLKYNKTMERRFKINEFSAEECDNISILDRIYIDPILLPQAITI